MRNGCGGLAESEFSRPLTNGEESILSSFQTSRSARSDVIELCNRFLGGLGARFITF